MTLSDYVIVFLAAKGIHHAFVISGSAIVPYPIVLYRISHSNKEAN